MLMLDAENAFPNLERLHALCRVRKDWPLAAMYIFNCYAGSPPVLVRSDECSQSVWLHSEEETQQGCPLAMALFGVATRPLLTV